LYPYDRSERSPIREFADVVLDRGYVEKRDGVRFFSSDGEPDGIDGFGVKRAGRGRVGA